jgi:hypothetical protein
VEISDDEIGCGTCPKTALGTCLTVISDLL